jgi:plasmid stabilization system protein ParE
VRDIWLRAWRFATRAPPVKEREETMPRSWTEKDERKYEHIKEDAQKRGRGTARAKEIAARTVNKQRRKQGRTENQRTMGTGNPRRPLHERSRDELRNRAKALGIVGVGKMKKADLVQTIQAH